MRAWNIVTGEGARMTAIGEPGNVVAYCFRFTDDIPPVAHELAAAPDLLEACEALVERIRILRTTEKKATLAPWPRSGVDYVGVDPDDCQDVKRAIVAIKKAKGVIPLTSP